MSYSSLLGEITTAIKAAWGDITDAKIYTSYEALRQNLLELKTESAITFPICVVDCGSRMPETTLSVDSEAQRMPLHIWYITTQKTIGAGSSAQVVVADKGTTLKNYFRSHGGTYWFQMEPPTVDASAQEAFNAKAGIDSKTEMIAVCVSFDPGLLVDATV